MKRALVIGGGAEIWRDVEAALKIGEFDAVIACNDIGAAWPGEIEAWVTLHPENMGALMRLRADRRYPAAKKIAYHEDPKGVPKPHIVTPYHWERSHRSASSGIFAAKVGIELGFKCVLCGVPLTMTPHFNNMGEWKHSSSFHQGFADALPYIKDSVRSMSGHTRKILGAPTESWLNGDCGSAE